MKPTKEQLADAAWWDGAAPDGAEVANSGIEFGKRIDGVWHYATSYRGEWVRCYDGDFTDKKYWRPTAKHWRGPKDGLPPVGTVCEYKSDGGEWLKVEVKYLSKVTIILEFKHDDSGDNEGAYSPESCKFLPLKSKEDDEREKAVTEMLKEVPFNYSGDEQFANALYNAGYRQKSALESPKND